MGTNSYRVQSIFWTLYSIDNRIVFQQYFSNNEVLSPTFVYLNVYEGTPSVYHFDLYRIEDEEELFAMGFDEYLHMGGVCCIEWAEKAPSLSLEPHLEVSISHLGEEQRMIEIETVSGQP